MGGNGFDRNNPILKNRGTIFLVMYICIYIYIYMYIRVTFFYARNHDIKNALIIRTDRIYNSVRPERHCRRPKPLSTMIETQICAGTCDLTDHNHMYTNIHMPFEHPLFSIFTYVYWLFVTWRRCDKKHTQRASKSQTHATKKKPPERQACKDFFSSHT